MALRRFFVDAVLGGVAELRGEEARHLTRVLRAQAGERYEISDNRSVYLAEIAEAKGERVVFHMLEAIAAPELPLVTTLIAALIKFDRFEWIVEKATELGVERILPVEAARSEKGLYEACAKRLARWRRIARESSQQCRRARMPEVLPATRFREALAQSADYRYRLEETIAPPLLRVLPVRRESSDRVALLVGPEGGWTDAERQLAADAGWQSVSLGPQTLRAETAAAAGLAILMNAWC